jgi:hypothetical protein
MFLKQNDGLIENKTDKTNCCVFGCNTCRKNEPEDAPFLPQLSRYDFSAALQNLAGFT